MHLHGLLSVLTSQAAFSSLVAQLRHDETVADQNIVRAARPMVAAALAAALARPLVIVCGREDRAYNLAEQLPVWLPEVHVLRFMAPNVGFYARAPWSEAVVRSRLETLSGLMHEDFGAGPFCVVTSAHALMQKTLPRREFRLGGRRLRVGQTVDLEALLALWLSLGYEPQTLVSVPGQFSRRGGIVDFFPATQAAPVRIEFWGDEIESLRRFDPATQRSSETLDSVVFTPTREALPKYAPKVADQLAVWFESQAATTPDSPQTDYEALREGMHFPTLEFYMPWLYAQPGSLLDYLPENSLILIDDWAHLQDQMTELESAALEQRDAARATNAIPPEMPLPYFTWDALQDDLLARRPLHLGRGELPTADIVLGDLFLPDQRFGGQLRNVIDYLHQLAAKGDRAIVVTRQAEHIAQLWSETSTYLRPITTLDDMARLGDTNFVAGELTEGWVLETPDKHRVHLLTDAEIFGWQRPEPRRRQRPRPAAPPTVLNEMAEGDYAVHVEHGIGRFAGLIKRTVRGEEHELLRLEYADNDILFVPIHQAERLTPYVGPDDRPPKLNRLGTQEWSRIRDKAGKAAEEIAEELLALYAKRELAAGHAFGPDTPWQHELEASFAYVETEDQLRALAQVKRDMESPHPMDRLICGDVGYGKTEIALRAAFKATMDGKQVAVLVPTTILAQQHYQTFLRRLGQFPVNIEMLSRFRDAAQQSAILEKLARADIDILIGTHRLLQADVIFKDLGLMIVDEEQRFGITHKEQLKQMRAAVDVLTLTATPIPRTLYMSITGIRDISLISTPPEERLPVITHTGIYDEKLVRQAILREIDRSGQVFFVHNRVRSINTITARLRELVPEASFAIAHGQMDERQLEEVIVSFSMGEYDVLVSTSIIENGVDIPNANTIILDHAEWFGLAPLYQLRGRVGRSAQQGYAYFFHTTPHRLTDEARARLDTISEETQLGAGFAVAMRDLEIRGAGDLLGRRQSGHVAAVGFHLYTQLLAEAVRRVKARSGMTERGPAPSTPLTIDLPLPTYIPQEYVPETALRIQLYRRMADLASLDEIAMLEGELRDRFGPIPGAVSGLLYQLRVKLLASAAHASAIVTETDKIGIKLPYLGAIDRDALQAQLGDLARVSRVAVWLTRDADAETWQIQLLDVLQALQSVALPEDAPL
ncbi:MAG: transcription-repair coupling factor [Anaerolineales bacterium]